MSHNPRGTELVLAACKKYPDLPSRTLARKLFTEHRGVWTSIESVRMAVLYRRGRHLSGNRPGAAKLCRNVVPSTAPRHQWNPEAYIPLSDEREFVPFEIAVERDTAIGVMGDVHIPYHSVSAVRATLDHGRRRGWRVVILNGDTLDFHRLSRFQKDPSARKPKDEIARANELLDSIDDLFPKARKIWRDGNHEDRYPSYLTAHAEELFDLVREHASLPHLLELESRGWEYVTEKRPIYLGGLTLLHGHEYPTPVLGPVNAARGLFLRAKDCAMVNHHHQTSEHTDPTVRSKIITTWSVGCLCDLHPQYARFNRWNHGAATVELAKNGTFKVHNFRIHDGQILN